MSRTVSVVFRTVNFLICVPNFNEREFLKGRRLEWPFHLNWALVIILHTHTDTHDRVRPTNTLSRAHINTQLIQIRRESIESSQHVRRITWKVQICNSKLTAVSLIIRATFQCCVWNNWFRMKITSVMIWRNNWRRNRNFLLYHLIILTY